MVCFTLPACRFVLGFILWCNQWNTFCSNILGILHHHRKQHWWERYCNRYHCCQRCFAIFNRLQSKFLHPYQGHHHDNGHTYLEWWNDHIVVRFPIAPCWFSIGLINRRH